MAVISVIESIRNSLHSEMERDEKIFVLGEDVAARGGVFLATDGLLEKFGIERVIDTPLAESSICGIAIGAAVNGMRPIAEIQFADFVWPAINQIVGEASKVKYGTFGKKTCPITIRIPYGGGVRGGLYHSQSIEVLFAHTPGLKVIAPATPYDAAGLLKSSIRDDDPVVFLEHKKTYRLVKGEVPNNDYSIPIGKAEVKKEGDDITIITYGLMLHYVLQAAEECKNLGINVEVVDLRTLRPIDSKTIIDSVNKTGRGLIVQEDTKAISVSSEVAAIIAENCFFNLDAPVRRITPIEIPPMPFSPLQEAEYMPSKNKILEGVKRLMEI